MQNDNSYRTNVHEMNHPLVHDRLARLRDKKTDHSTFRQMLDQVSTLLVCELTKDLALKEVQVETPVCTATCKKLANSNITLVPILRAGLGMIDGILKVLPEARIGHIGLARNEETLQPAQYYMKMPEGIHEGEVVIVDPMLATGGSIIYAIKKLRSEYKVEKIKILCLVAAPEGLKRLYEECPDVHIYCAAVDEKLNEVGYIVPGLGDAGDRINGTFLI